MKLPQLQEIPDEFLKAYEIKEGHRYLLFADPTGVDLDFLRNWNSNTGVFLIVHALKPPNGSVSELVSLYDLTRDVEGAETEPVDQQEAVERGSAERTSSEQQKEN